MMPIEDVTTIENVSFWDTLDIIVAQKIASELGYTNRLHPNGAKLSVLLPISDITPFHQLVNERVQGIKNDI